MQAVCHNDIKISLWYSRSSKSPPRAALSIACSSVVIFFIISLVASFRQSVHPYWLSMSSLSFLMLSSSMPSFFRSLSIRERSSRYSSSYSASLCFGIIEAFFFLSSSLLRRVFGIRIHLVSPAIPAGPKVPSIQFDFRKVRIQPLDYFV